MSHIKTAEKPWIGKWPWKEPDRWDVSLYNFDEEIRARYHLPKKIEFHDTTMRDGEQHPGVVFTKEDKVKITKALTEYGVQRIETMPSVSKEDYEATKMMTKLGLTSTIFSFSRSLKADVTAAIETDCDGIILEMFVHPATPAPDGIMSWTVNEAIKMQLEVSQYAKEHGLYVTTFYPDATRTPLDFLKDFIIRSSRYADAVCLVDTWGVCTMDGAALLVRKVKEFMDKPVEFHGHNHFGLGTASALGAVAGGAEVIHACVNCLGHGSGNVSLEEAAINLRLMLGVETGIKLEKTYEVCKLVEALSGLKLQTNKPFIGEKVYDVEAGIVGAFITRAKERAKKGLPPAKWSDPMAPSLIGRAPGALKIGKQSGHHTITLTIERLNLQPQPIDLVRKMRDLVKAKAVEKKDCVTDEEFKEIYRKVVGKL